MNNSLLATLAIAIGLINAGPAFSGENSYQANEGDIRRQIKALSENICLHPENVDLLRLRHDLYTQLGEPEKSQEDPAIDCPSSKQELERD